MTVRGLNRCREEKLGKIQEFARIIFVDDLKKNSFDPEDSRPLQKRPVYEAQDVLKVVC